jgi:hypothetical protein
MMPAWNYRVAKKSAQETEKAKRKYLMSAKGGLNHFSVIRKQYNKDLKIF